MNRSGGCPGAGGLLNLGFSLVDLAKRSDDPYLLTSNLLSKLLSVPADGRSSIRPAAATGIARIPIRRARKTAAAFLE